MTTTSRNARVAGLIYLSLVMVGPLRLIYIPARLFVHGNATATVSNITAHELLFRFGMVSDLIGGTLLVFLALALYRLFEEVDRTQAVRVVILGGVMPALLYYVNVAIDACALALVHGADYLSVFEKPQRDALAMLFLRFHDEVNVAAEVLWGLWLFPLAILTIRSGFLPRFLGVWLIVAGISYLALSVTGELLPQSYDMVYRIGSPARLGEIAFLLWLLIMGAKVRRPVGV
jgi:hypothetical protein